MTNQSNTFEFHNLDDLLEHVGSLKPGECCDARHASQRAEGVKQEMTKDQRFNDFKLSLAQYRRPFQQDDPRRFTICRKRDAAPRTSNG